MSLIPQTERGGDRSSDLVASYLSHCKSCEAAGLIIGSRSSLSALFLTISPSTTRLAFMAEAVVTAGAATEHAEAPQLAELLNPEAGRTSDIELKVIRSDMIKYSFKQQQGPEVSSQKVQVVLQSKIADQYCLGVAKLQKKDYTELKKIQDRFQTGTVWKFDTIKLVNEKPSYVHTACRITLDLRQSQARAMLQSTSFPEAPVPPCHTMF